MFEMMDRGQKVTGLNIMSYLEELVNEHESQEKIIAELEASNDVLEKDNDNLKDKLMELENEVDYMKNGKMNSDEEELY